MAPKADNHAYYPKTFEADGLYTHATGVPSRLIETANHFYQGGSLFYKNWFMNSDRNFVSIWFLWSDNLNMFTFYMNFNQNVNYILE